MDYVQHWTERAELPAKRLLGWMGLGTSKFHQWCGRYGKVQEHNGKIPRDWWLEDWEKQAILDYNDRHPLEGYRRLSFMMLDDDVVAVSPSSVYRVLKNAGRLDRHRWAPSKKGTGFVQPDGPHKHWHLDISYVNLGGTFYFLITVLDGYSRYIVHEEIRENMREFDMEVVVQRALEKYPGEHPRIITDNGPQFMARDFKEFIRLMGLTHVRTEPLLPAKQRQAGTLAWKRQAGVHPPGVSGFVGGSLAVGSLLCGHVQPRAASQRLGVYRPGRQTQRLGVGDLRRAGSQAGRGT